MKLIRFLFFIQFITISPVKSDNYLNSLGLLSPKSEEYPICIDNGKTEAICITNKENLYIYNQEFGGRSEVGENKVFTDNKLEHTLPKGWYENKSVKLDARLLSPGNYDSSLTLFGRSGVNLSSGSVSECTYGVESAPSPLTNQCKIIGTKFIYKFPQVYGDRSLNCDTPSTSTKINSSKCWLKVGSGVYLASASALPFCKLKVDTSGLISEDCIAPKSDSATLSSGSFFYNQAYNGKSNVCSFSSAGSINTSSCYVPNDTIYYKLTNICSIGLNTISCDVPSNYYPYTSQFGGRSINCDDISNTSNCWFSGANKSTGIGINLINSNIKTGVNIFGKAGSYDGNPTDWGTGAAKDDLTVRGSYKDESYCGLGFKWIKGSPCQAVVNHRQIPKVLTDHDGENSNFYVDRSAWGNTQCGLSGTVDQRILDCSTSIATALANLSVSANSRNTSTWNSDGKVGNSGFGVWKLITRVNSTLSGIVEVWRDENTKLYWSSRVSNNINWCRASGSSNNLRFPDMAELDPSNICNLQSQQEQQTTQSVFSACFEDTGFTDNHVDINQFVHTDSLVPSGKAAGKAGLNSASTQKIYWRLPTIYDYKIAHFNGMRFVLADMSGVNANEEWTSTIYSMDRSKAWTFNSANGQKSFKNRTTRLATRCIGRGF